MTRPNLKILAALACLAILACDDEPNAKSRPRFDADGGSDAGPEWSDRPAYAVISSDFSSTSVSLLAADGKLVADDYLNSGSTQTGLVTALSGDVAMPTVSGERHVMVLIDRLKTDVITRVDLSSGDVLGQVKTQTPVDQQTDTAFSSNPQDYIRIGDDAAWVSRSEPNLDPDADEIDRGNDLLRIDPRTMQRTDDRIDLSPLNASASRTDPMTGKEEVVDTYARPGRIVRMGRTLVVGLSRSAFDYSASASGMIAIVDLDKKTVRGLDIEGLQGCSQVLPIPNASDRVLVGCGGIYPTPRDSAGIAIVRMLSGDAAVISSWKVKDHDEAPAISEGYVALDAHTLGATANAFVPGEGDSVFGTIDLETGEFTQRLSTPAGGTFGTPLYDATSGRLFVPDASADADLRPTAGVRVLVRGDDDRFEETDVIEVAKDTGLPARHVFRL
jgi:hypothetical protein